MTKPSTDIKDNIREAVQDAYNDTGLTIQTIEVNWINTSSIEASYTVGDVNINLNAVECEDDC